MKPWHFLFRNSSTLAGYLSDEALFSNVLSTQNITGFIRVEGTSFLPGLAHEGRSLILKCQCKLATISQSTRTENNQLTIFLQNTTRIRAGKRVKGRKYMLIAEPLKGCFPGDVFKGVRKKFHVTVF